MSHRMVARAARWTAIALVSALMACSQAPSGEKSAANAPAKPASAPAAAPAGDASAIDKDKIGSLIKRYFEAQGQIPADVTLAVTEVTPSEIPGLFKGTLKLSRGEQSQELPFYTSADGRWFLRVDPIDLNVDPVQDVIKKITLGPENPSRGPQNSKVTIVEYSDFQCPFCAKAEVILRDEVWKQYGDKVRFVYKQFPLTQIHPWAETASTVGLCLYKQAGNDAYWKYHEAVFSKAHEIPADTAQDALLKIAKESGGDEAKVKDCVDKQEPQALIDATQAEAESVGVNSTPTFFINGRRLSGAQPLEAFKGLIEPELQKGG